MLMCRHSEVHNEILHDESIAFATDTNYPESAPVIAELEIPAAYRSFCNF